MEARPTESKIDDSIEIQENDDVQKIQQNIEVVCTKVDNMVFNNPPIETATDSEEFKIRTVPLVVSKYAERYNISEKNRGKAYILNHKYFEREETREGTEKDVEELTETLKLLKFTVKVHDDLDYPSIITLFKEIQNDDHTNEDCIMFFILTHGNNKREISAKDVYYPLDKVWEFFTADKCPSLAGKPKLFFINACRGKKIDRGIRFARYFSFLRKNKTKADGRTKKLAYEIPNHADFLIAQSTIDGHFSFRDPEDGTWYIQILCDVLKRYHNNKDLLQMLTITGRKLAVDCKTVSDIKAEANLTQVSSFTSMLIRDVYFKTTVFN